MKLRSALACVVLVAGFALPSLAVAAEGSSQASGDCPMFVVRAHFTERAAVDRLVAWTEPWQVDYAHGFAVVGVDAAGYSRLIADGFEVEVDQALTAKYCAPAPALPDQVEGIPGYPCYRTVEETYAAAQAIAAAHPDLATVIDVGDSWDKTTPGGAAGYDMLVLQLTNSAVPGTPTGTEPPHGKPRLLITCAIHAREYTTAELGLRFAEQLVSGYGVDPDATWLLDEHEIHILLYTNPDGRKIAEGGVWWRKNTNANYCASYPDSRGADLNRNFPYQWGCCGGSSGSQCDETYRGASAGSEPEAQAVRDYSRAIFPDQKGPNPTDPAPATATGVYVDLHSYSELVLWPWGYTSTAAPNGTALQTLGRRLAFFNSYTPEQSIGLYPTDGTTVDFTYGDLGIAAYTVELGTDFFQDCGTFTGTILPDNLDALRYYAKVARTPYLTPGGPSVTSVLAPVGATVAPGTPVDARAVVDDLPFNNSNGTEPTQNITAAEVYLDEPPWREPAPTPIAMAAQDGSFDAKTETVVATVPTTGLADGRHILYFRGQDGSGAWGAVSAAFFWVLDPAVAPHIAGTVTEAGSGAPLAATVSAGIFSITTDPGNGSYDLMVAAGTYDVTATAADHAPATVTGVVASNGATTPVSFALAPFVPLLDDDVEAGNIGWTAQSPWAITTEASSSPTHSWTDSPGGQYLDNRDVSLTSPTLDLSQVTGVTLEFNHTYDTESGYDYCHVEVSSDGSTWTEVTSYNGAQAAWQPVSLELPQLDGVGAAQFRFRLTTDGSVTADGWHVDDILVRGASSTPEGLIFADGFESGTTASWSAVAP
jgi:carboxypeptidase T